MQQNLKISIFMCDKQEKLMLSENIDLHIHTTCSDGLDTPEEIVDTALEKGLKAIAIADHDAVEGVERAIRKAANSGLIVVPGIELSTIMNSKEYHILGYFIDYTSSDFITKITFLKNKRHERAKKIINSLNSLGLDLQFDTVLSVADGAPIGRPHIAEALLIEELVDSYEEAFFKYIGRYRPAYVPHYKVHPKDSIEFIRSFGGVPVLAHPGVHNVDVKVIHEIIQFGLEGIESIHPLHTKKVQLRYEELCSANNLIYTGGSDWHGNNRVRSSIHNLWVSDEVLIELKARSEKIRKPVDID